MDTQDGGERHCVVLNDEKRLVDRTDPHPPHDWEWPPDHGPQVITLYHCPGV